MAKWLASFIRIKLQRGNGGSGGGVLSGVGGSKALDPPLIIPRVSWVGHLQPHLSLVTGALSGSALLPPFRFVFRQAACQKLFVVVGHLLVLPMGPKARMTTEEQSRNP